jgi:SWI/SNF-related matrix-associated actin-dependent regulator 1 of chromatin subfamily A
MPKVFAKPSKEAQDDALKRAQRIATGLFPHQVEGVAFLLARRKVILADDMGLGKTRQAIVALRESAPDGPYLVVCPASVKRNWAREIFAVAPDARIRILGDALYTCDEPKWIVVNYDILGKHIAALNETRWAGIVFDEAHMLKNRNSQRSKVARELTDAADRDSQPVVYALTGTPVTNRPRDLFPLLQILEHPLGRSFLSFAKRYCAAYRTDFGWVTDGASNLDDLALQLKGALLRRTKDEVLDLPPKIRSWLPVEVAPGIAAKEMYQVLRLLIGNGTGRSGRLRDRGQLLSLLTKARLKLARAKVDDTIKLVQNAVDQGEKVIVFSCFDEPLQKLKKHFGDAAVLLTGATPTAARQKLVDAFQNDDSVNVFAANIIAGGVGLNLTAARQVIFNDLDWVPANHWQAEDRAYRIGQTNTVHVTYVIAEGTVDDFVATLLSAKTALFETLIEGKANTAATSDILTELEQIMSALSPRLPESASEDEVEALIAQMTAAARAQAQAVSGGAKTHALVSDALERAIASLAESLRGPKSERHRITSKSRPDVFYDITVNGTDVTCTCPGFEYRGECSHSREFLRKR